MKTKNKTKLIMTLIAALMMAVLTTGSVLASEGNEIEVEGTVVAIYPDEYRLEIEVDNDGEIEILSVQVGHNFDFDIVVLGDLIEAKGTLNEDGTLVLTELKIQERERDREKTRDGEGDGYFCEAEDKVHPVAMKAAETYGMAYEDLLVYLCSESPVPLGQILLALQTAYLTGEDLSVYLESFEGISWGQIWQELELIGKPGKGTPPGQIKKQAGEGEGEPDIPKGQKKKDGEDQEGGGKIFDWFPKGWFKKGNK
jgi:hypothetical protein